MVDEDEVEVDLEAEVEADLVERQEDPQEIRERSSFIRMEAERNRA